ncbi:MAG: hypothetical protein ACRD3J_20665 [Thermoanaerobaculia bacterium]
MPFKVLDETLRQLRSTRNDIIRYAVWNTRNLTDDEFNHADDRKLLGYFRQDLLETRFLSKGRRIDLIQLWHWFDDQVTGTEPMLIGGEEHFVNVQDKDLDKVRKRIAEIQAFLPTLRGDDLEAFKRVKYKLRRTVLRLTYDLHHLFKRMEKYRKNFGGPTAPRPEHIAPEPAVEIPEPPQGDEHEEE